MLIKKLNVVDVFLPPYHPKVWLFSTIIYQVTGFKNLTLASKSPLLTIPWCSMFAESGTKFCLYYWRWILVHGLCESIFFWVYFLAGKCYCKLWVFWWFNYWCFRYLGCTCPISKATRVLYTEKEILSSCRCLSLNLLCQHPNTWIGYS